MRLTIIEPHEHFGVLMRWIQVCVQTNWKVQIITSQSNWSQLNDGIPEDCEHCHFFEISNIPHFPKTDFLIFTSMQTSWWKWLKYTRKYPSALIIHNGNTYLKPFQSLASWEKAGFTLLKYSTKWLYEQIFSYPIRRDFLEAQDYIIPFSTLQIEFFQKYSSKIVAPIHPRFKQLVSSNKKPLVLLYLYNRLPQIDCQFFKEQLMKYKSKNYAQLIVISSQEEIIELKQYFDNEHKVRFLKYPLPPKAYFNLLRKCMYVCLPFKQERVFNIFKELIGVTKYSGRIRDALEFGCEVHMPDYIPREDPNELPTLTEATELMQQQLDGLYAQFNL